MHASALLNAWQAANREWLRLGEDMDQRHAALAERSPARPYIVGPRGWCITRHDEIDGCRYADSTKRRLHERLDTAVAQYEAEREAAGLNELEDRWVTLAADMEGMAHQLAADRSGTLEAVQAKLTLSVALFDEKADGSAVETALIRSALADINALSATVSELMRLSALMGFGPGAEAGPGGAEVSHLLELERQHTVADERYNAIPDSEPDEVWQPALQVVADLENQITDAPITTMVGALVKLRLARGPVGTGDGLIPQRCLDSASDVLEAVAMQAGYNPPWRRPAGGAV
ncbi:hypothetical protein FBZ83_11978 [Azospirillum brasilense]|uniref:Uncharacterized protein n=1 Tax=Azospirillum brasilense TaxID=192 RepID=A0A560BUX4_AZOBR|nr:hypothetical protein [Azospirillum brasilense]TWA76427.1 hypothetical protein FBZ83_11978 [Azospirillum brasilense]